MVTIAREELTVEMIESDSKTDRIEFIQDMHFLSGEPATLYDETRLPSINLGHSKWQQSSH